MNGIDLEERFLSRLFQKIKLHPEEIPSLTQIYNSEGDLISESFNLVETENSPIEHSEILCIRKALQVKSERYLYGSRLITSFEPCLMCAGAILHSRIPEVLYFMQHSRDHGISSLNLENFTSYHRLPRMVFRERPEIQSLFKDFFF